MKERICSLQELTPMEKGREKVNGELLLLKVYPSVAHTLTCQHDVL